jgi:hypothetical protein
MRYAVGYHNNVPHFSNDIAELSPVPAGIVDSYCIRTIACPHP